MITLEKILEKEQTRRVENGNYGINACKESIKLIKDSGINYWDQLERYVERANSDIFFNKTMVLACWELINEELDLKFDTCYSIDLNLTNDFDHRNCVYHWKRLIQYIMHKFGVSYYKQLAEYLKEQQLDDNFNTNVEYFHFGISHFGKIVACWELINHKED